MITKVEPAHDPGPHINGHGGCFARAGNGGMCPGVATTRDEAEAYAENLRNRIKGIERNLFAIELIAKKLPKEGA